MKIWLSILCISSILLSSEVEYGVGTFSLKGGFLGLTNKISTDIESFSLVDRHTNIFSNLFYSYEFTWYDSKVLRAMEYTYNDITGDINDLLPSDFPLTIPAMDYRMKGLDVNLNLGYDILHQDQDNFLGIGVLLGVSAPWIDSSQSINSVAESSAVPSFDFYLKNLNSIVDTDLITDNLNTDNLFEDSETKIMEYKLGLSLNFQKTLISNKLSIYGLASYAKQKAYIKNSYADAKFSVNGTFQQYNIGLYFTPFTQKYKLGWLTLSPRIYATLGYRYSDWELDKMTINISGLQVSSDILSPFDMKFGMETSVTYFGIGYSF